MTDARDALRDALSDRYRIERELGAGGMATVYLAHDVKHDRRVAIKVLRPELAASIGSDRFLSEIRTTANLQHPHILPLFDSGQAAGFLFYVMPFIEEEPLRQRLARGPLPVSDVVDLLRDVARALGYAHGRGIVHRDIKPDNVLLSGGSAVVADFGIAKAISAARTAGGAPGLTGVGTSIGTPAYMAPEQAAGDPEVDARADIYAFGCMAYELLTGQPPFAGPSPARIVAAQISETPRPVRERRADVPPVLADIVMRCLAKDPAARPQSGDEILRQLGALDVPVSRLTIPGRGRFIGAGLVLVLVALGVWALVHRRAAPATGAAGVRTLAVLPIENVGGDSAKEYLADGMTGELSGALRQTPGLQIVGDLSTFRFKHSRLSPTEIAHELGVALLLTGRLQSQGGRIRLQMQLLDVAGKLLWSKQFDRETKDNFALQDEVTGAIASEMQLALSPGNTAVARAGRTANAEAHDLYLRGVFERNKLSEQGLARAVTYFEQALALDPGYAQASAGLAFAYDMQADAYLPSHRLHVLAKAAAERAIRSDSMLAEAHVLYGFELAAADWDYERGGIEMRRGLALDPNAPDALFMYGVFLGCNGSTAEALAISERLRRVDPLSAMGSLARAQAFGFAGRWAEALRQDSITKSLDATVVYIVAWDGEALRELGRLEESRKAYLAFQDMTGQPAFGLALTYARMGRRDDALGVIHAMEEARRHRWVDPTFIAAGYAGIGDTDRAMEWIRTGLREKTFALRFALNANLYWLRGVQQDPRYVALRREVMGTPRD